MITLNRILLPLAVIAIAASLWGLHAEQANVRTEAIRIGAIPAMVFHPQGATVPQPVVVIAHGFSGSQQLMQSFALTFARNGYTAVTFDFAGHGRNPTPLTGSITDETGATRTLQSELARVVGYARGLGDGRLAVLGHSMASDVVVRLANDDPTLAATIAVSMFSPAVTATAPRNLLVIVGDWEGMLKEEALRAVGLSITPTSPVAGVTYGDLAVGTGRRAAFSPHVEHASVLFSQASMREAATWLDQTFTIARPTPLQLDGRGPWILLLIAAVVALARPLSQLLPRVVATPVGAGLAWRQYSIALIVPMLATPVLLRVLPTHFLPVLVADYLAAHFAVYGLLTALCLYGIKASDVRHGSTPGRAVERGAGSVVSPSVSYPAMAVASLAMIAFGFVGLVWPINQFVTSFVPGLERIAIVLAMLVGTLIYFLSDEWLTRGVGAARGAYLASKAAFLSSLGLAVALDFERLFFLVIIIPVIVLFFAVYGLLSRWAYRQTGHPFVGGLANAFAFAWAIGVTFPLLAG